MFSCISWLRKTYGHFLKNSIAIFLFTFRSVTNFRAVGGLLGPAPTTISILESSFICTDLCRRFLCGFYPPIFI